MLTFWAYCLAIIFAVWSNKHFGWNALPGSDAELIADGIALLLSVLAMVVHAIERKHI